MNEEIEIVNWSYWLQRELNQAKDRIDTLNEQGFTFKAFAQSSTDTDTVCTLIMTRQVKEQQGEIDA